MTVSELIEILKAMPPGALVITPGFDECSYDPVEDVELVRIADVNGSNSHGGQYETEEYIKKNNPRLWSPIFDAVCLDWARRGQPQELVASHRQIT